MYNPPAFAQTNPEEMQAIMQAASLPVLVSPARGGGLLATHLPLLFQAPDRLVGHVAKGNFHWRDFDPAQDSLAIFTAAEGYVSPSWYPSKQEGGRVVPTWNYSVVHATGRLSIVEEPQPLLEIVTALTSRHEAGREHSWQVADAPADYIAGQLKGIVGLVLTIAKLEGKAKLSQNKSLADREGVIAGAAAENPALAEAMRRQR
ncbi:MAG TPA: FMN-binding negative transcriptional regulator [Acidocella sp.]|nr:FMN-binding negative transcriptional regulator [Acidocella sp.]